MRKFLKISVASLVIIAILFLGLQITKSIERKAALKEQIEHLPDFSFRLINGNSFTNIDIDKSNNVIINYFNPECEHCQYMASCYLKNAEKLKAISIVMVTTADSSSTERFVNNYRLNTIPSIVIVRDTKLQFDKIFGQSSVPSFFIYKDKKLLKKVTGETKIENLIDGTRQ